MKKITKHKKIYEIKKIYKAGYRLIKLIFKHHPYFMAAYTFVMICFSLIPLLQAFFQARVIDEITKSIGAGSILNNLVIVVILYLTIMAIRRLIGGMNSYFQRIGYLQIDRIVTLELLKTFARLDLEYYESPKSNNLITRVQENTHQARSFVDRTVWLISDIITLATSITLILSLSPLIFIIVVITSIPQLISELIYGKKAWGIWDAKADVRRDFFATRSYFMRDQSLQEIKTFRTKEYLFNYAKKLFVDFQNEQKKIQQKRIILENTLGIVSVIGFGISTALLIVKVLSSQITIGLFTFYTSLVNTISSSIQNIFVYISRTYEDGLFVADMYELMDLEPRIISGKEKIKNINIPPTIEFKNVWFKYPNTKEYIFKNLNFKLNPGEHIAIVGENGAGKTTLVKLLLRYYDVTKGKILINNINIKDINTDNWYKFLAPLMQNFIHYHFDAKTNIGLGNKDKIKDIEKIKEASTLSGSHSFIEKYKYKYNQVLSRQFPKGISPSTGQWQKIALARAFFKDAPILILDEPTSAIDPKSEYEIFQKLFDFAKQKTVIIISHRFSTVRNADYIIVLDDGKIKEKGNHKELLELNGVYKEAYDLQKKGYEDV
ncbi:hypothetical protein COV24_04610 [candidate division WWE3 bacterium CG10_big_fil_rev_8_21_14_0_10_32_10]|uniref:ABC transporter ATP-binding protein n=1 Tax=candidate division WWE3 bacterium CG10_big_fil_rev_8_21_14_0_10_32_10 TaxID=1975090 RepID=A0A2H0RAM4_UNCKA|nr:MAG: hypothetical protein COV24_04610 [candidate division WWE3 bacterium CG10_big_fil_rev_8_21_14_0_10_32_10]